MKTNPAICPPLGRPPRDGAAADHQIHLRVTRERKGAYVRAARPAPMAEWMCRHLDAAAGYAPPEK